MSRPDRQPMFFRRRRAPWLVFALCALLVIDVLAWASWRVLALENAEQIARLEADAAQRARLALWQMDSLVSALVARESARPYFEYRPVYAADLPYGDAWRILDARDLAVSPLATRPLDPVVQLHYQIEPGGNVISPQAPDATASMNAEQIRAGRRLRALAPLVANRSPTEMIENPAIAAGNDDDRREQAEAEFSAVPETKGLVSADAADAQDTLQEGESVATADEATPEETADATLRMQLFDIARSNLGAAAQRAGIPDGDPSVDVGVFRPRWLLQGSGDPELVFERAVTVAGEMYTQGVWLDWSALRAQLLSITVRLLPGAELQPIAGQDIRGADALATIPLRVSLPAPMRRGGMWTPTRVTLAVSWLAAVVALVAVGIVLRTAMRLADRRGRFVAAVTHELRSPLTSFRLHTDLLERAQDATKRERHIGVLRAEAARLSEVIESVLVYAGLRAPERSEAVQQVGSVIEPLLPGFQHTVSNAGLEFVLDLPMDLRATHIRTRAGSVERILTNLIENACRYGSADGGAITLTGNVEGQTVRLRVADAGPGIDARERDMIFRDFYRGTQASRSHRGIGLGLALGRSLARAEHGDLRLLETDGPGAVFELSLPKVPENGGSAAAAMSCTDSSTEGVTSADQ